MIKRIFLDLGGTTYTPVAINLAVQRAKRFEAEVADKQDCAWQQLVQR
jgi:hypothetical protein